MNRAKTQCFEAGVLVLLFSVDSLCGSENMMVKLVKGATALSCFLTLSSRTAGWLQCWKLFSDVHLKYCKRNVRNGITWNIFNLPQYESSSFKKADFKLRKFFSSILASSFFWYHFLILQVFPVFVSFFALWAKLFWWTEHSQDVKHVHWRMCIYVCLGVVLSSALKAP